MAKEIKIQVGELSHSGISGYSLPVPKEKSSSLIVYYDDGCGLCSRWIRSLQKYGALEKVTYQGLSDAPEKIQQISRKENAWIISRDQKNFIGYSGFVECMKQSRIFSWYGYIGNIPPLSTAGNIIYRLVSRGRNCNLNKR